VKLQQLRYLIQVAESGSFTKAATKLNMAQTALSRQIKLLEEDLGVTLFRRDGRGVEPTAAGSELVRRATALFTDLYEMRQAVVGYRHTVEGDVTIGMMPLLGAYVAPALLLSARDLHPNVKIKFMVGMSHAIHEWAIAGRIDFGVVSTAIESSSYLMSEEIAGDRLHLVTSADQPGPGKHSTVTFAEALAQPLVIPSKLNGIRAVIDSYALEAGLEITPVIEVDSLEIIKRLVPTGIGRTILPRFSVTSEVAAGQLRSIPIVDPELDYRVAITYSVERPLSPTASAIATILRQATARALADSPGPPERA
jgi:LysR family transcriptional regulator, nitrogen assimilation regulatory protein